MYYNYVIQNAIAVNMTRVPNFLTLQQERYHLLLRHIFYANFIESVITGLVQNRIT